MNLRNRFTFLKSVTLKDAKMNPRHLKREINRRILEMAIGNAKAELAKRGLDVGDVSEKQLELIVNDEERKIRESFKNRSIGALLAILGLQIV